jgi:hypothetical protein
MLFLFEGIFKQGSEERVEQLRDQWSERLAQQRLEVWSTTGA